MIDDNGRTAKYWLCDNCAESQDLVTRYPDGCNTIIKGLCGHCSRSDDTWLTPIVDFKHKNDKRPDRWEDWD